MCIHGISLRYILNSRELGTKSKFKAYLGHILCKDNLSLINLEGEGRRITNRLQIEVIILTSYMAPVLKNIFNEIVLH